MAVCRHPSARYLADDVQHGIAKGPCLFRRHFVRIVLHTPSFAVVGPCMFCESLFITYQHLMLAKEELLARVFPVEGAETDEAGHQGDDLMTGQTGETDDLIQREPILDHIEQMADIIVVG